MHVQCQFESGLSPSMYTTLLAIAEAQSGKKSTHGRSIDGVYAILEGELYNLSRFV